MSETIKLLQSQSWNDVLEGIQKLEINITTIQDLQTNLPKDFGVSSIEEVLTLLQMAPYGRETGVWIIHKSHDLGSPVCPLQTRSRFLNSNTRFLEQGFYHISQQCAQFWKGNAGQGLDKLLNLQGLWNMSHVNALYNAIPEHARFIKLDLLVGSISEGIPVHEFNFDTVKIEEMYAGFALFAGEFTIEETIGSWTFKTQTSLDELKQIYGLKESQTLRSLPKGDYVSYKGEGASNFCEMVLQTDKPIDFADLTISSVTFHNYVERSIDFYSDDFYRIELDVHGDFELDFEAPKIITVP